MTKSEEVDKLDANLDRLYRAFGRQQTTSAVTITGGGALTIVGVFAITIALAAVMVIAAWRQSDMNTLKAMRDADMKELSSLRDEIHKVSVEQQTDRIWLTKLDKEKR